MAALVAAARARSNAARPGSLRIRRYARLRVFPYHRDRLAVVCHGEWSVSGDRGRRQRGPRWSFAFHGRRIYAEPCGGAERRLGMPTQSADDESRIR